jgi:hypothetical protein
LLELKIQFNATGGFIMPTYWGNSKWRLRLAQDLQQLLDGNISPVQTQIDQIQSAIATQTESMEDDNPTKLGLNFISELLETAQEESELVVELAKEAARTASSVNRAYNSRKYKTSSDLRERAGRKLQDTDEEGADVIYALQTARLRLGGSDETPLGYSSDRPTKEVIKAEFIKTAKSFVEAILPEYAEEVVWKFAAAIVSKESDASVASSLRYEIAADLKEYDNLPIPDEFENNTGEIQPQKSSYKGKPLQQINPNELGFTPSSGTLAPKVGDKFAIGIAVVLEAGTLVVLKGAQIVSAAVGAITSFATSTVAWFYLGAIAIVAVLVAFLVKKSTEEKEALTGQYLYLFAELAGDIHISFAVLYDKLTIRNINNAIVSIYNNFQSYSEYYYPEAFIFIVDDEDSGKPEHIILDRLWITGAYILTITGGFKINELDETLWKVRFDSLNSQVDELYRFK